tara:strand:- start:300 stop:512 length:213 start_codon:yes stop_codon:yes gene_type:complete
MPTASQKKAYKDGLITKSQYDKLPSHLLDAIIRSKRHGGTGGFKETHTKIGSQKHKVGRPRKGEKTKTGH